MFRNYIVSENFITNLYFNNILINSTCFFSFYWYISSIMVKQLASKIIQLKPTSEVFIGDQWVLPIYWATN